MIPHPLDHQTQGYPPRQNANSDRHRVIAVSFVGHSAASSCLATEGQNQWQLPAQKTPEIFRPRAARPQNLRKAASP